MLLITALAVNLDFLCFANWLVLLFVTITISTQFSVSVHKLAHLFILDMLPREEEQFVLAVAYYILGLNSNNLP